MAKRMDVSCILFTVPTPLQGQAPHASPSAVQAAREGQACSVGTDKRGHYAASTLRP